MSMNIRINAKQKPTLKFPCEQTPTSATYEIMESPNPLKAYRDYMAGLRFKEAHVKFLDKWVKEVTSLGMEVEVWIA